MEAASHDEIEPLVPEWDDLADRVGTSPFQRAGWFLAWWRAFGTGSLRVLTLRDEGRLVGLVPLYRAGPALRSLTNPHTPEFGPLVEGAHAVELVRALFDRSGRRISLAYLLPGRPRAEDYRAVAAERGYRLILAPFEQSPFVKVDADWASFERGLDPKLRGDLRRRLRRLEERGPVTFDVQHGREGLADLLDEGLRVEAAGWKGSAGTATAIACRADTRQFYAEVARWAAERGSLRLCFLRVAGAPAAFEYALEEGGVYYRLKVGVDPAYKSFSPGKLLLQATLRRAFDAGLDRFDFLGHAEPYKLEWTTTCNVYSLLHAFPPTAGGRLEWVKYAHVRPLAVRMGLRR